MEVQVLRWSIVDRVTHWMLISGFLIALVTSLPLFDVSIFGALGGVMPNYWARNLHLAAGFLLTGAAILHVGYRIVARKATGIFPTGRDISNLKRMASNWLGRTREYPKLGFHHPSEKIVYWGAAVLGLLLMGVSGFVLWLDALFSTQYNLWAIAIKDVAFLIMGMILIGHVAFALQNMPTIKAMCYHGKVSVDWATSHHPLWIETIRTTEK